MTNYNTSLDIASNITDDYGTSYFNPNLLIYMSHEDVQINNSKLKNVIINGVAISIVLTSSSNGDFYVPEAFTAMRISHTQNYTYPTYVGESAGWRSIGIAFLSYFDYAFRRSGIGAIQLQCGRQQAVLVASSNKQRFRECHFH